MLLLANQQAAQSDTVDHQNSSEIQGQKSGPSVAPYPTLRLVPATQPPDLQPQSQGPVINPNDPQGLPSWYRIPPSLYGRRITIVKADGTKQEIVFTGSNNQNNTSE